MESALVSFFGPIIMSHLSAKAPSPSVISEGNDDDDVFGHHHHHTPRRQSNPSPRVPPSAASPNSLALDNW